MLHYVINIYININYIASHCIGLHIYILPITHTHTHPSFQCIPPRPRRPSGGCSCLRAVGRFSRFFHWQLDCTWVRQKRWLPQIFRFFLGRHVFSGTCEATFLQIHGFKKQSAGLGHGWEKFGCFPLWTPCCDYKMCPGNVASLPQSEKTVLPEVTHASSKSQLQRVQTSPRLERTEGIHNKSNIMH